MATIKKSPRNRTAASGSDDLAEAVVMLKAPAGGGTPEPAESRAVAESVLAKVSKASATQRAGRAGRTRAGHCVRLYTRADHEGRPDHDAPEIRRVLRIATHAGDLRATRLDDDAAADAAIRAGGAGLGGLAVFRDGHCAFGWPVHVQPALASLQGGPASGAARSSATLCSSV